MKALLQTLFATLFASTLTLTAAAQGRISPGTSTTAAEDQSEGDCAQNPLRGRYIKYEKPIGSMETSVSFDECYRFPYVWKYLEDRLGTFVTVGNLDRLASVMA